VAACLLVAGAGAFFWYTVAHRPLPERVAPRGAIYAASTLRAPAPVGVASATPPVAAPALEASPPVVQAPDEPSLMSELRALINTAPAQALALARRGDALFPNSPDAPERAWAAVKSLDLLKRFHEAQAEARLMLRLYPDTPWTEDVERHVLLYPLDQPSREEQQAAAARTTR